MSQTGIRLYDSNGLPILTQPSSSAASSSSSEMMPLHRITAVVPLPIKAALSDLCSIAFMHLSTWDGVAMDCQTLSLFSFLSLVQANMPYRSVTLHAPRFSLNLIPAFFFIALSFRVDLLCQFN